MTETMIVEAVRAAGSAANAEALQAAQNAQQAADPNAVARFAAAMAPQAPAEVPFAAQVAETFNTAQGNYQEMLHRIRALSAMSAEHSLSVSQLSELQYEVANLTFQQNVVTNIAKKASDAVSTLVRNS